MATTHGLCLGGNVFGWTADEAASFAVLDAYAAAGGNFVDTADQYSDWVPGNTGGESEAILGSWLDARGNRDEIVVATKVGSAAGLTELTAEAVRAGLDASLERLRTDHVDVYYIHRDRPDLQLAEVLGAMTELVAAGTVRQVGVSNFTPARLRELLGVCAAEGFARPAYVQPAYNLMDRGIEADLLPLCRAEGIGVVPYYGLASGFLTGKYRPGADAPAGPRAGKAASYLADPRGPLVLEALEKVAAAHDVPLSAVALAWVAAQPGVAAPIASARTVAQLEELLAFTALTLADDELDLLAVASA